MIHPTDDSGKHTRRQFLLQAGQSGSVLFTGALLVQLLEFCDQNPASADAPELPKVQGTKSGSAITLTIDSTSPLSSSGGAAFVQFSGGSVLVARTGANSFVALTPVCTHQQCTITEFDNQQFVCPCHGSRFTTTGQVARGPASASLATFQTQFSGDVLTILL